MKLPRDPGGCHMEQKNSVTKPCLDFRTTNIHERERIKQRNVDQEAIDWVKLNAQGKPWME